MKKALKYILAIFVILNFLIILSGKSWLYKAVSVTYLKGYTPSYIDDYIHFHSNSIKNGNHQEWLVSKEYNKARDFARLGKLYMNQGNWNGTQLLDSNYVKEATSVANLFDEDGNKNINYDYQFWVANRKGLGVYYRIDLWGQYVICMPEKDMIIVRLSRKYGFHLVDGHLEDFCQFIGAALEIYPQC